MDEVLVALSVCALTDYNAKIALEKLHDNPKLNDRIFLNHVAEFKKTGTLGASKEEVRDGLRKALNLDCEMVIAIGEAATKYKSLVFDL